MIKKGVRTNKANSLRLKELWKNPEYRKEQITRLTKVNSLRFKKLWEDPEYRKKQSENHKGSKNYWFGIKMSEERKNKIRIKKQGKRSSPSTEFKKGHIPFAKLHPERMLRGSEHHRWTGGCSTYQNKQALIRDNYTCQICGMRDIEIMEVDHIKPKSKFPELRLDLNNLMTLCPNCHRRKTNREKKPILNGTTPTQ